MSRISELRIVYEYLLEPLPRHGIEVLDLPPVLRHIVFNKVHNLVGYKANPIMSERTRGSHTTGLHHEANDLTELHASKAQESLRHTVAEPANTDLSSASIQSISVVRLSARPEKRKIAAITAPTAPELEPTTEPHQRQRSTPSRGQGHGILKNPYFPYQGGPLERFITLLANLLKYLERSLLASLRPQAPQPPLQKTTIKTKKRDASGREIDEDEERSQKIEAPIKRTPLQ